MHLASPAPKAQGHWFDPERSAQEIRYMEARLDEIGHDGDCAYEKAMIKFFQKEVAERMAQLAAIQAA